MVWLLKCQIELKTINHKFFCHHHHVTQGRRLERKNIGGNVLWWSQEFLKVQNHTKS